MIKYLKLFANKFREYRRRLHKSVARAILRWTCNYVQCYFSHKITLKLTRHCIYEWLCDYA